MTGKAATETVDVTRREGQEGSRWVNQRPTGREVADWFEENVPMPEGLESKHYVSGITLIQQTEKSKEVVGWSPGNNEPVIAERTNLIFTPYAKVETRVKFFHDLMRVNEDWRGVVEPVIVPGADPNLPPGFFYFFARTSADAGVRYICCSMKVTVFKGQVERKRRFEVGSDQRRSREVIETSGDRIIDAPPGTKMIKVLGGYNNQPDANMLMKAETGAVGRALGLAGMLVIPGTGVATAEDVAEAEAISRQPEAPPEPELPLDAAAPHQQVVATLRTQALVAINTLKEQFPAQFEDFRAWASERGIARVNEVDDEAKLRGLVTKAESALQDAEAEAADATPKA